MRIRTLALISGALLTMAVLAGCTQTTYDMGGMPGMDHGSGMMGGTQPTTASNAADQMFVQMMIPHHQQAIEMADLLLGKSGIDPRVTDLAKQIKAAQGPEIDTMNGWLRAWGIATSTKGMDMGGGMMSDADMTALRSANGTDAARLFLQQMTTHHQGAIDMAKTEVATGTDPAAIALAKAIIDGQTAEIATMQTLLGSLR
ncbi:MAG: DUF305 domain-containing protein [Microbacterium ginsengisoli]|nr:DUF305 domain-containing protein [Microbacterium ginsengisoli]